MLRHRNFLYIVITLVGFVWVSPVLAKCAQADKSPQPNWVNAASSYERQGFHYGVGVAQYIKKEPYSKQLQRAKSAARSQLGESLLVRVQSDVEISSSVSGETVDSQYRERVITQSDLELPGLTVKSVWHHPKKCTVYALAALSKVTGNLVTKKAVALQLKARAENRQLATPQRLAAINNAIGLAQQWSFGQLSNSASSSHLIHEFEAIKKNLSQSLAGQRNILLFVGEATQQALGKTLSQVVAGEVAGTFNGGFCASAPQCLRKAQTTPARYATIIKTDMPVFRERGLYLGHFNLSLTVWDLSQNKQIYRSDFKTTKVMHHQEYNVNLTTGFNKWQRIQPEAFVSLARYFTGR